MRSWLVLLLASLVLSCSSYSSTKYSRTVPDFDKYEFAEYLEDQGWKIVSVDPLRTDWQWAKRQKNEWVIYSFRITAEGSVVTAECMESKHYPKHMAPVRGSDSSLFWQPCKEGFVMSVLRGTVESYKNPLLD